MTTHDFMKTTQIYMKTTRGVAVLTRGVAIPILGFISHTHVMAKTVVGAL